MNIKISKLVIASTLFFSSLSQASAFHTPVAVPKNLHVYNTAGSTYVDLVAANCSGYRYYLSQNHPKYDAIFSILLAAQTAGKKVQLRVDKCINGSNPQGNIIGVYLKD